MALKTCKNGHQFEKTSDCPVCPVCSSDEMDAKYGDAFPKIGAPAFRALDGAGIKNLTDLVNYSEQELLTLHGFGPRALRLLKEKLQENGLKLKVV